MADVTPILINQLASQTTLQDTDYFIVGGDDAKKITVAQMKEALGINSLNTNIKDIVKVVTQQGKGTVNIPSHGAIEATDYIDIPELEGYTRVLTLIRPYGFANAVW